MFPLKELAFELRALIYPHALILQPDNSAPAFLLALAADETLYAEAQHVYRSINTILTIKNQDAFGKLKMNEVMKIRHLRCVFPGLPKNLQIYKPLLLNNLLSLTLDFSTLDAYPRPYTSSSSFLSPFPPSSSNTNNPNTTNNSKTLSLIKQLFYASRCGVETLSIKFGPWIAAYGPYTDYGVESMNDVESYRQENLVRCRDIESLNCHFGVLGRLERVVELSECECWVWDGGVGGLRWRERVNEREEDGGVGSVYERSARAWRRDLSIRREL